jgi:hypothetical protein
MTDEDIKKEVFRHVELAIAASLLEASRQQHHSLTMSAFNYTAIARHILPRYRPCLSQALYEMSRNESVGVISKEMTRISSVYLAKFYLIKAPPGTTHTGTFYTQITNEQQLKNWIRQGQAVQLVSDKQGISAFGVGNTVSPRRIGTGSSGRVKTYFDRRSGNSHF